MRDLSVNRSSRRGAACTPSTTGTLDVKVESVDDSSPEWRTEKVSYAAAYGGERIPAYLFLPKNAKAPYQVMVVFPGSGAISQRSSANAGGDLDRFNFIMRSGRALLFPVYKSTFERGRCPQERLSEHDRGLP